MIVLGCDPGLRLFEPPAESPAQRGLRTTTLRHGFPNFPGLSLGLSGPGVWEGPGSLHICQIPSGESFGQNGWEGFSEGVQAPA